MKIRHPLLVKAAAFAVALTIKAWLGTARVRSRSLGPEADPLRGGCGGPYVYAFWHEYFLMPLHTYSRANLRMIVSRHADGEIVTQVGRYFRLRTVRGSSRRGGVEAARQILRHGRDWHLAVTPDGPRGPRRQFQPGAAYLASRTGRPLVPCGIGYERPWRLKSWDRFAVPRPWSDIVLVLGHPIRVPEDAGRGELEHYRLLAEREMHRLTEVAEAWAETGKFRPLWNAVARAG